jgi:dTMP kinase
MLDHPGLFVTIEGPNGVGKTSVMVKVASRLRRLDFDVIETSEPTQSNLGHIVRTSESTYHGRTYACLVAADRYLHIEQEIIPAVSAGKIALSARYVESSLVLQRLDGVDIEFIWALNSQVRIPDMSVILTASPATLEHRLGARSVLSRFESTRTRSEELAYYVETAEFLSKHNFNVICLDNEFASIDENADCITGHIKSLAMRKK